jgi:hypothetical protein
MRLFTSIQFDDSTTKLESKKRKICQEKQKKKKI